MINSFKLNSFLTLSDFQFFTANYGKISPYSFMANVLCCITAVCEYGKIGHFRPLKQCKKNWQ